MPSDLGSRCGPTGESLDAAAELPGLASKPFRATFDSTANGRQARTNALGQCSKFAGDSAGGSHQSLEQELRNELDDGDSPCRNGFAKLRARVTPANAFQEGDEGIDGLQDATKAAPGGLERLNDQHHSSGRWNNQCH